MKRLVKDLKSTDSKVRAKAAEEIGKLGQSADIATEELCKALLDRSKTVVKSSLEALEKIRPELYKLLVDMVLDAKEVNQTKAIRELGLMGEKAAPALVVLHAKLRSELAEGPSGGSLSEMQVELFKAIRQINLEDVETLKMYKILTASTNRYEEARDQALAFIIEWAGKDKIRLKEIYPLLKSGLSSSYSVIRCLNAIGDCGSDIAKYSIPIKKNSN